MHPLSLGPESVPLSRSLSNVAARFERASLDMLRTRALLRRTDTKFLISSEQIVWLLAAVTSDYALLPSGSCVLARYQTIYLDTPDLLCFNEHRRGRRPRHKVRIRHYLDRQTTFFEIKTKDANELTTKYRAEREFGDESYGDAERSVVARYTGLPPGELVPALGLDFSRMTLLGKNSEERITIDVDLRIHARGLGGDLTDVSVVEVKQPSLHRTTTFMQVLRAHGLRPRSSSKYCSAMALTQRSLRTNGLRPFMRALERIQG